MIANRFPSAVAGMRQRKISVDLVGVLARRPAAARGRTQWIRWSCQTYALGGGGDLPPAAAAPTRRPDAGTVAFAGSRSRLRYVAGERMFS